MGLRISDEQAKSLGITEHIPKRVCRANVDERGMNKTEARYARRLDELKHQGLILDYWFEAVKFRLADRCWYTPDFLIELPDRSKIVHETKGGYIREDGWLKLKFAAETMPFPFFLAQWKDREWEITRVGGRGLVRA